jgi:hypothetical protein
MYKTTRHGARRRLLFALAAVAVAASVPLGALMAVDVYLHRRYEKAAGFNVWGYRGPVVPRKRAGEYRVVVLGGSAAYGYGVDWHEAIPAVLEHNLARRVVPGVARFSVVNLGYNNEGAYSFRFTLEDYLALQYDLACLYEGYNDLMGDPNGPNLSVFRHDSPVFRLTGYLPIFPLIFREKAAALLHGGDTNGAYLFGPRTVFHPNVVSTLRAGVLRAAADTEESLERQLARVATEPRRRIVDADATGCAYPWQQYCRSMEDAVEFALARKKQVLIITQPYGLGEYFRARHMSQQSEMVKMLSRRFGSDPRVKYVNLGDAADLGNPGHSFDHMHLTVEGNQRVAAALVDSVIEMATLKSAER